MAKVPAGNPFEALGDPNRRRIVELLSAGGAAGRSVQQLADALPISRPAVSRHLRILRRAGLVVDEPRGTRRIYRLHDEGVEAVRTYLSRVWGEPGREAAATSTRIGSGARSRSSSRLPRAPRSSG